MRIGKAKRAREQAVQKCRENGNAVDRIFREAEAVESEVQRAIQRFTQRLERYRARVAARTAEADAKADADGSN